MVGRWLSDGHRIDDILSAIDEACRFARTPPQTLRFFENPIAQLAHAAPQPGGYSDDRDPSDGELGPDLDGDGA